MRIQPITSLDDLDDAIASAERDHQSRWYVARVAQAMGVTDRIPTTWDESQRQVETFRELSEDEQEAVSEHLSAISAEVDDYAHHRIGMEDLEDAALAASIAAGEYAEQFETGLVASVGVFAKYGKISDDDAEAIVAAAKKPRKVRTQAGVRRFKQPLHSVIMPGGKVLKPGDAGYDAADKAAGGSGGTEKSGSSSDVKARIGEKPSTSTPKAPTAKADKDRDTENTSGQRAMDQAKFDSLSKTVTDLRSKIDRDNDQYRRGQRGSLTAEEFRDASAKLTAAKKELDEERRKIPLGERPEDKAAAKLVRAKVSEISKAKTNDDLDNIDTDELKKIADSHTVHPDVDKLIETVSDFRSNKKSWNDYRQRAA